MPGSDDQFPDEVDRSAGVLCVSKRRDFVSPVLCLVAGSRSGRNGEAMPI